MVGYYAVMLLEEFLIKIVHFLDLPVEKSSHRLRVLPEIIIRCI